MPRRSCVSIRSMNPRTATLIAGGLVGVVATQSLGSVGGGGPTIASPAPLPLILPIFLGVPVIVAVGGFMALFWLWSAQLFQGATEIPRRTAGLMFITAALSAINFALGWKHGVDYQGTTYVRVCLGLDVLLFVACAMTLWRAHVRPSFLTALIAHTLVFSWLASYALPYLGETP